MKQVASVCDALDHPSVQPALRQLKVGPCGSQQLDASAASKLMRASLASQPGGRPSYAIPQSHQHYEFTQCVRQFIAHIVQAIASAPSYNAAADELLLARAKVGLLIQQSWAGVCVLPWWLTFPGGSADIHAPLAAQGLRVQRVPFPVRV